MNTVRRPRFAAVKIVIASLALAAVAACGSSDDSKDEAATESSPSAVETTTAPAEESNPQFDAYVDKVRSLSQGEMARFDDVYSDFQVSGEGGDTLVYEYTFINELDPDTAETQIEGTRSVLEGASKPIFDEMKAVGVEDPKVRWTYRNPDGAELHTIEMP